MKKYVCFLVFGLAFLFSNAMYAQEPSAIMDIESTDQGILIPRTDTSAVNAAYTPAVGLMIFQTLDSTFYLYDGAKWTSFQDDLGNHMAEENLNLNTHFISHDGEDNGITINPQGGVGIGRSQTNQRLTVYADSSFGVQVLDQEALGTGGDLTISPTVSGAQSFVIDTIGHLLKVVLSCRKASSAASEMTLELKASASPDTGASIEVVPFTVVSQVDSLYEFVFSTPVSVMKDDMYVLVVSHVAGGEGIWQRSTADIYAEGSAYIYASGWLPTSAQDHWFRSYVEVSDSAEKSVFTVTNDLNVGVGTDAPMAKLDVNGSLRYTDGTEAENYVLTSDADGDAAWKDIKGLMGLDDSDRNCSSIVGSLRLGYGYNPDFVAVQGNYAYSVGTNKLRVIDVSEPTGPVIAGSIGLGDFSQSVAVQGNYAYVLEFNQFKVIDVSTPANPVLVDSIGMGLPKAVAVQGNYAYVVDWGTDDLRVIDVSAPTNPIMIGSFGVGSYPQSVAVQGNYAFVVSSGSDDLSVINVSAPTNPVVVGSIGIGSYPRSVTVQGNYAYVIDEVTEDLKVIDVSEPTSPVIAGSIGLGDLPKSIAVEGFYAYVVIDDTEDLKVIDVRTPTNPVLTGSIGIGTNPSSVAIQGNYAYVTDIDADDLKVIRVCNEQDIVYNPFADSLIFVPASLSNWIANNDDISYRNSGRVGIGTGSPAEKLDVNGFIRSKGVRGRAGVNGVTSNIYNVNWTGASAELWIDVTNVGTIQLTSDRRLKKNIVSMPTRAIDRVLKLRPVEYRYKDVSGTVFSGTDDLIEGFVADELEEVIPSAVNGEKNALTTEGTIQPQTVNALPIISVLTKAIQEQEEQIRNLTSMLESLQKEIREMEKKLE